MSRLGRTDPPWEASCAVGYVSQHTPGQCSNFRRASVQGEPLARVTGTAKGTSLKAGLWGRGPMLRYPRTIEGGHAMTLVLLFGPPSVGKATVAYALARETGLRVFHNHMAIEPVLAFFEFGTSPFERLVGGFRRR